MFGSMILGTNFRVKYEKELQRMGEGGKSSEANPQRKCYNKTQFGEEVHKPSSIFRIDDAMWQLLSIFCRPSKLHLPIKACNATLTKSKILDTTNTFTKLFTDIKSIK